MTFNSLPKRVFAWKAFLLGKFFNKLFLVTIFVLWKWQPPLDAFRVRWPGRAKCFK